MPRPRSLRRRELLKLGAAAGGAFFLGGLSRLGGSPASAGQASIPTVDRLVMTSVVDNVYDVFARGGQFGELTVRRTPVANPPGSGTQLISEHGLAYHLLSERGSERREILLDFALTGVSLATNYHALGVDPARADALILSHGHNDHYGALPGLVGTVPRWSEGGITLYAGARTPSATAGRSPRTGSGSTRDSWTAPTSRLAASRSSWPPSPASWRDTPSPRARSRG